MKYALIIDNAVTQIQLKPRDGFIAVPDDVVCGQIKDGDSFTNPPAKEPSPLEQARAVLQSEFDKLPKWKQKLWEPLRAAVSSSISEGDFATARTILEVTNPIYPNDEADRDKFMALMPSRGRGNG